VGFKKHPAGKTPAGENSSEPFVVVNYDFILSKSKSKTNGEMALSEAGGLSRGKL
jgi:hypothetical protein